MTESATVIAYAGVNARLRTCPLLAIVPSM